MVRTSTLHRMPAHVPEVDADPVPHHSEYPVEELVRLKGSQRISVCIPAHDEERTIGPIVAAVRRQLLEQVGLVDEILVLDHDSRDGTARIAAAAGATVVATSELLTEFGAALGKGDALWRSVLASTGDIIVWLDADLEDFDVHFVTGLLGPLLQQPEIMLVRATYQRALGGVPGEGGRVTELLARPVIAMLFPELAHIRQPLGGEYAIRRIAAESLPFEPDYGVEMGLLLDVANRYGVAAVGQVDLGVRTHRNRPLTALREQSRQVLRAVLCRTPTAVPVRGGVPLRPPIAELRDPDEIAV